MAVVDWCLRRHFPEDYDTRCMYAAFGISALLNDAGIESQVAAGDMYVFTMTLDGKNALLQGFAEGNADEPSHFWVVSGEQILDLGPSYLPRRSTLPISPIPWVAWKKTGDMPNFLTYDEHIRYAFDVEIRLPEEMIARMDRFLAACRKRFGSKLAKSKSRFWILTDQISVNESARRRDKWAEGALRYQLERLPRRPLLTDM